MAFTPSYVKVSRELYDTSFLRKYNFLSSIYAYVLPNDIKEVFKWINFIVANIPKVGSALNKMSSIAVTSLNYLSPDLTELSQDDAMSWKSIVEEKLKIKSKIKEIGYNFLVYGNVFISVNFPIERMLECAHCKARLTKKSFKDEKLEPILKEDENKNKQLFVKGTCPKCQMNTLFTIHEYIVKKVENIKIIQWPVHRIDLYEDEITGIKHYYYTPTESEIELIKKGNKDKIFYTPKEIIVAALSGGKVKFDENKIFHARGIKLSGTDTSWGLPMLTNAIPDTISLMLLRKLDEKITTDMIMPLRALVPRVNGVDQNSLYNFIDAGDMKRKIESVIKQWKKDPTSIQFFPIPLEPMSVFGEGKQLKLTEEIDAIANMILASIGIPVEFLQGGLSYAGAGASLRVLQNQLIDLTTALEEVVNFIIEKVAVFLEKSIVKVKLIPLKLIDDISDKQNMLALFQSGKISGHTALNFFDLDYREEQERLVEEQKQAIRNQMEIQRFQQEIATSLEDKIRQESMVQNSSVWNLNQTAIIQEADNYARQLMQLDYGLRKSKLDELAKENPVLYAVVKWRMEFFEQKQATQAKHQNNQ